MQMMGFMGPAMSMLAGAGAIAGGNSAYAGAKSTASQLNQLAGQSRATGQRDAIEKRRQAALVNSRLQAVAGGGAGDVGVVNLAADIAGEGEYRALTSLFEGESDAIALENKARVEIAKGKAARTAGYISAIPSLLSAGNSMYDKFGGGGFSNTMDYNAMTTNLQTVSQAGRRRFP